MGPSQNQPLKNLNVQQVLSLPDANGMQTERIHEIVIDGQKYQLKLSSARPVEQQIENDEIAVVSKAVLELKKFVETALNNTSPESRSEYVQALIVLAEVAPHEEAAIRYSECWQIIMQECSFYLRPSLLFQLAESLHFYGYHEAALGVFSFTLKSYGFDEHHNFVAKQILEVALESKSDQFLSVALSTLQNRLCKIKKNILDELVSVYEEREGGTFTAEGHAQLRDFFSQVEFNATLAEQLHGLIINLTDAGHYTSVKGEIGTAPPNWFYNRLIKDCFRGWEVSSYLYEALEVLVARNHFLTPQFHALADATLEFATITALACPALDLKEWSSTYEDTQFDPEKGVNDFFTQLEKHPRVNQEYDFRDLHYSQLRACITEGLKHSSTVRASLSLLSSIEASKSELSLFRIASGMLPKDLSAAELFRFEHQWEKAIIRTAEQLEVFDYLENPMGGPHSRFAQQVVKGFEEKGSNLRPGEATETHAVCEAILDLATFLLSQPSLARQEEAIQLLESISENTSEIYNIYIFKCRRNISNRAHATIRSSALLPFFVPLEFKARAFLEASVNAGIHAESLRNRGLELLDRTPIPELDVRLFSPYSVYLIQNAEVFEILSEALEPRALEWYTIVGQSLLDAEEYLNSEMRWFNTATEDQKLERGYSAYLSPQDHLSEVLHFINDWKIRLTAKLSIYHEGSGNRESAIRCVESVLQSLQRTPPEEIVKRIEPALLAAEELVQNPALKEHGKEIYMHLERCLASQIPKEEYSGLKVCLGFFRSVQECALDAGEKDRLLEKLLFDLRSIPRSALSNTIEVRYSLVPMLKEIAKQEEYPLARAESLQLAATLIEKNAFDTEDTYRNSKISDTQAELAKYLIRLTR